MPEVLKYEDMLIELHSMWKVTFIGPCIVMYSYNESR
jgi:hypothetical protein